MRISRLAAAAALIFFGCGTDTVTATQVVVSLSAAPVVHQMAKHVHVTVRAGQGEAMGWEERYDKVLDAQGVTAWPIELSLLPKTDDATRVYEVTATATDAANLNIAKVRAISGFIPYRALKLVLRFDDECIGKVTLCSATQTCRGGICEDAHVDTATLLPFTPSEAELWDGSVLLDFDASTGTGHDAAMSMELDAQTDAMHGDAAIDKLDAGDAGPMVSEPDAATMTMDAGTDSGPMINACGGVGTPTCAAPPCMLGASCASAASDGNGNVCVTCTNKSSSKSCCIPSQCGTYSWTWQCNGGTALKCTNGLTSWDGCGL